MPTTANKLLKLLLVITGSISLVLGVIGIFLPILPTTPFLLVTAACYAKSSRKFYDWLLGNRYVGQYIKNYREKKGIPLKAKIITLSFMWISITFSALFFVKFFVGRLLLFLTAAAVSFHIASLGTLKRGKGSITNSCED